MKKLISSLLLTAALLCPSLLHAEAGCTFSVASNPKVTAQYGITIIVFSSGLITVLGPGVAGEVPVSNGDLVLVQTANYVCGSQTSLQWGYKRWSPCGLSGTLTPQFMAGNFTNDWYIANVICNCPQPGQGFLDDMENGTGCAPQPQPQQ